MAGTPRKRARRDAIAQPRPIVELLEVIGWIKSLPYAGAGLAEAYKDGKITHREAQLLQQYSHRSPKSQKRALREEKPVTAGDIEAMRAKLDAAAAKAFGPDWRDNP